MAGMSLGRVLLADDRVEVACLRTYWDSGWNEQVAQAEDESGCHGEMNGNMGQEVVYWTTRFYPQEM